MTKEQTIEVIKTLAENAGIKFIVEEEKEEVLKDGDKYYYIFNSIGTYNTISGQNTWTCSKFDEERLNLGNVFRTREEAEKECLNIKIQNRLRMFADEVNEGWEPNWKNASEYKWFLTFNHYEQEWVANCVTRSEYPNTIYFKTGKLAELAIEEILIPILEGAKEKE